MTLDIEISETNLNQGWCRDCSKRIYIGDISYLTRNNVLLCDNCGSRVVREIDFLVQNFWTAFYRNRKVEVEE